MLGPMGWVLVYTNNMPVMRRFYEEGLGLPLKRASELIVVFDTGGCLLELMGRMDNGPDRMDDSRGWQRNKVLVSFHVKDIRAEVAALAARGVHPVKDIHPTVSPAGMPPRGELAQYMDPDGNLVEICSCPLG